MLGCGGSTCCGSCKSGMGGLQPASAVASWPRTTQVLIDYAERMLARGQPFYISPAFNSDALAPQQMGFVAAIAAAATAVASVIGVASSVKTNKAIRSAASDAEKAQIAADIAPSVAAALKAQGIILPESIATQSVEASIFDAFGAGNRYLVMGGLGALVLLLILKKRR